MPGLFVRFDQQSRGQGFHVFIRGSQQRSSVALLGVLALVGLAVASPSVAQDDLRSSGVTLIADGSDPGAPSTVPEGLRNLPAHVPLEVIVDPSTGLVLRMHKVAESGLLARAAQATPSSCTSNRPCWHGAVPSIWYGFTGTGTVYGPWEYRSSFQTKNRQAKICWQSAAGIMCTAKMAKNVTVTFTTPTTGRSVTLY